MLSARITFTLSAFLASVPLMFATGLAEPCGMACWTTNNAGTEPQLSPFICRLVPKQNIGLVVDGCGDWIQATLSPACQPSD